MDRLSRQYAKRCDVRDFDDPQLLAAITDLVPERDARTHVERKVWEFGMLILFLEEAGRLTEETRALGVGAGTERILFWLANRIGEVVATDIYGQGDFADQEAPASMLTDPASHAPGPYREDRLAVRAMDARELAFDDASFDVVFSVSSFEHFGSGDDIARAAREAGRVLRPGGHAVIITECWVRRHPLDALLWAAPGRHGIDVLTERELHRHIVEPSGLELLQPFDPSLSDASWDNLTDLRPGRPPVPRSGSFYPHVLLRYRRSVFTSACLVLQKPRSGPPTSSGR